MPDNKKLSSFLLPVTYDIGESFDPERFIKMRLRICHDGDNLKGTHFNIENMERSKNSLKNIPILANVIFDENDEPQFGGHDMDIEKDKVNSDEYRLIYKETPIGVIPENNNYFVENKDGKNYVYVDAYIWRKYSNYAEDIITRDQNIKLSMEIDIKDYSVIPETNILDITDYKYCGVTFLNNEMTTGMENALASVLAFSGDCNGNTKILDMINELNSSISMYDNKNDKGGRTEMANESGQTNNMSVDTALPSQANAASQSSGQYTKLFSIPDKDIRCSLYDLSDKNADFYIVSVSDNYFIYANNCDMKCYMQNFSKENGEVKLAGAPTEVYAEYMTAEEKTERDKITAEYSEIKTELNELREYKVSAEKALASEQRNEVIAKWDKIIGKEESFEQLKNSSESYTADELEIKCKCIFADKNAKFSLPSKSEAQFGFVSIPVADQSDTGCIESVYGDLFTKYGHSTKE